MMGLRWHSEFSFNRSGFVNEGLQRHLIKTLGTHKHTRFFALTRDFKIQVFPPSTICH